MAKTFDATLNTLIDEHLVDWAAFLAARVGVPPGPPTPLDTDLSTTLQADRLFRVDGPSPAVLHLELESTGRLGIPDGLLRYNVAAWGATHLPVYSVLVLLRPKANASDLTGTFELSGAGGPAYLTFRYTVVRVWEETVAGLLAAGPGVAPLALLTNEAAADLPVAFARFRQQLQAAAVAVTVERGLLGSTFVLCGLRYAPDQIEALYRELSMTLEDSTTYQLILNKGRAEGKAEGEALGQIQGAITEAQRLILRFGSKRFGRAPASVEATILAIDDRNRLERLADRVLDAHSWEEVLATP